MDIKEAQVLIDRYMDGETTAAEERALRHFFRTAADVPEQWRPLRALFAYVDDEARQAGKAEGKTVRLRTEKPHRPISRWWWTGAVAASVLAALLLWPKTDDGRNFAVIDGERVTDQRVVVREAEQALQLVAISDEEAFSALDDIN